MITPHEKAWQCEPRQGFNLLVQPTPIKSRERVIRIIAIGSCSRQGGDLRRHGRKPPHASGEFRKVAGRVSLPLSSGMLAIPEESSALRRVP